MKGGGAGRRGCGLAAPPARTLIHSAALPCFCATTTALLEATHTDPAASLILPVAREVAAAHRPDADPLTLPRRPCSRRRRARRWAAPH